MRKCLFVFILTLIYNLVFCQKNNKNSLTIELPFINNKSEATFYRLGRPIKTVGATNSFGLMAKFNKPIFKQLNVILGLGYFNQKFDLYRPYEDDNLFFLLNSTQGYSYRCINGVLGIGYNIEVNSVYTIKSELGVSVLTSFAQKYVLDKSDGENEKHDKFFYIGRSVIASIGLDRKITNKLKLGISIIKPFSNYWEKDRRFIDFEYENNLQKIANTLTTLGFSVNATFNLYKHEK